MSRLSYVAYCGLAVLVFACASMPVPDENIAAARAAIQNVEAMPLANEVASQELGAARAALANAESLAQRHRSANEIANATYLAKRHADIAAEQITVADANRRIDAAKQERQAIVLQSREREAQSREREAQLSAQEAQHQAEETNARAAEAEAANREARAANSDAQQANRKVELLQQELAALNAKKTERGLVMTMGDVLFDTGKANLKPGAMAPLDRLAKFLKDAPERSVMIEGHTDSVGSEEYNQELSQQRADTVREALLHRGVSADRIQAVGKGKGFPVASNSSAGGRQQNRRVEIVIENPPA